VATLWDPQQKFIEDSLLLEKIERMVYDGRPPASRESVALLGAISKAILASPDARREPQYVALGYWLRAAAIERMCIRLLNQANDIKGLLAPRGIALHLPPTNVDTIFVYSWAISVLAGNCNIVRLPSQINPNTEWLVALISNVIFESGERARQLFCKLPREGKLITEISAHCDLRMIWGGDAKVASVSKILIRPDGLSIGFPDRKSIAVIKTLSYRSADEATRNALAAQFFNDIFWFDQMGCGSPRVLYWVGEPKEMAADLFERLSCYAASKMHKAETGIAIAKFAAVNAMLAEGLANHGSSYSNALHVVETEEPCKAVMMGTGGGFLAYCSIDSIEQIAKEVTRKTQTIGHFGFADEELHSLARAVSGRGGYRIVPIGRALQFDIVWDGLDLIQHMTRRIVVTP
jgi:hypothetical protein